MTKNLRFDWGVYRTEEEAVAAAQRKLARNHEINKPSEWTYAKFIVIVGEPSIRSKKKHARAEGEDHKEKAHGTGHHSNGKEFAANKAYARDASGPTHCNEFVADAVEEVGGRFPWARRKAGNPAVRFPGEIRQLREDLVARAVDDWSKQIGKMFGQLQDLLTNEKPGQRTVTGTRPPG